MEDSNIFIRKLDESDYDNILVKWWEDWKWTPPEKEFLPGYGTFGMIVFDGETPVCAGFLYFTNSAVAWIEFVVSNPKYRKKPERKLCIGYLIERLSDIAKSGGYSYCYSLLKNDSLIQTYKQNGFVEGDNNIRELIKRL